MIARRSRITFSAHALARFRQFSGNPDLSEAAAQESYRLGRPISRVEAAAAISGYIQPTWQDVFYRTDGTGGAGVWVLVRPGKKRPVAVTYLAPGPAGDDELISATEA